MSWLSLGFWSDDPIPWQGDLELVPSSEHKWDLLDREAVYEVGAVWVRLTKPQTTFTVRIIWGAWDFEVEVPAGEDKVTAQPEERVTIFGGDIPQVTIRPLVLRPELAADVKARVHVMMRLVGKIGEGWSDDPLKV